MTQLMFMQRTRISGGKFAGFTLQWLFASVLTHMNLNRYLNYIYILIITNNKYTKF